MNKHTGIIVGVVACVVVAAIAFVFMGNTDNEMMQNVDQTSMEQVSDDTQEMSQEDTKAMDEEVALNTAGVYEDYAVEKLNRAATGEVVLFFNASWCPSCRGLDTDIKNNVSAIPEGVSILKVDYDKEVSLKKKYGVTYQHTLVQVDTKGEMIKRWSGSPTLSSLVLEVE